MSLGGYLSQLNLPAGYFCPALYVHVPFCFHKCHYCDFYSITRQPAERMHKYVDLILREADLWRHPPPNFILRPHTVFFGGGTPTMLPIDQMHRLIAGLQQRFDFSHCDEFTIEVNPATVDAAYCRMLKIVGVNRLSLGAQSFNPAELAILERHHQPPQVEESLRLARSAGFERINFDLIFGIPGQTMESWQRSLQSAIALGTTHLSCYGLTYEPNTPLAVKKRLNLLQAVDETLELDMLLTTRRMLLQAGLQAYEISNYAIPGEECRHNLHYWHGGDYIALGPSGASHLQGLRWRNRPHLGEWEQAIEADALPAIEIELLNPIRRAGELAMLMLRLRQGIDCGEFLQHTGFNANRLLAPVIARYRKPGLLCADGQHIFLTERGVAVADSIIAEIFMAIPQDAKP